MLIKKFTGFWGHGVQHLIKSQQRQNKKLVKILLATPSTQLSRYTRTLKSKPLSLLRAPALKAPTRPTTAPVPGKWLKSSHAVTVLESGRPGARMSYWLYLPDQAGPGPMPLVVMLHGCAQTATQFAQSTRMNQLAEKKGFAVLYPQQTTAHNTGRCWRWYNRKIQEGGAEVQSVVAIINNVVEKYALDPTRIYIAGISAGAAMANIIALNYPHLIAAVGMHSGSVFGTAHTPMEGYSVMQNGALGSLRDAVRTAAARVAHFPAMPAMLIHGQQDNIVRPVNLSHLAEQFNELNQLAGHGRETMQVKTTDKPASPRSGNAYRTYEYYAGKKMLMKVCDVSDLGHAWSGGDASSNFSNAKGPDASRMMWDFFSKHRRLSSTELTSTVATYTNADSNG